MYSGMDMACRGGSRLCSCLFVLDVNVFSCLYLTSLLVLIVLTSLLLFIHPTIDHLSERGFSRLPHWIKKTSDLIEPCSGARFYE